AGGHAFVQVDAQLSNNTADPKLVVSKAIKSVIGRVSAATFDSDLLPNADNTYSVGQTSPDLRWRNGNFAGTVTVGTGASGGNLGIGVKAPSYPLDVQAATGQIQIKSTTGTNYALLRVNNSGGDLYFGRERSAGGGLAVDSTGYAGVINAQSAYPLQFAVNNHVAMTILNSGYVGVGTSTPSVRLEAYPGPVKLWGGLQYYTAFQNGNEINMFTSSTVGTTMYLQYASNAATNIGKSALYIQGNNGNVGMGTTGPGQKLDVIGNIRASGVIMPGSTSTPPTTCNSSYASSIYYNSSDTKMYYCNGTIWKVLGAASSVAPGTVAYTNPGTHNWTVPDGVSRIIVELWGGGGGGGGENWYNGNGAWGGGGGSGAYIAATLGVFSGTTYSIVVGAGGSGGMGSPYNGGSGGPGASNGSNGGNTTFGGMTAFGGNGGYYEARPDLNGSGRIGIHTSMPAVTSSTIYAIAGNGDISNAIRQQDGAGAPSSGGPATSTYSYVSSAGTPVSLAGGYWNQGGGNGAIGSQNTTQDSPLVAAASPAGGGAGGNANIGFAGIVGTGSPGAPGMVKISW
ncbi:MAG: hypothetical protein M1153_02535, partial [Patescibacteria group bacterium]|nr:hypothetical protein [Patescibacteria group bacterium]